MPALPPSLSVGPVDVYVGAAAGKYPDGNQVIVRGRDTRVAFDTPPIANHIGLALDGVDLVILGHVHEDHMAGLHRLPHAPVHVHHADLAAAQSWEGLSRHYGYPAPLLEQQRAKLVDRFHNRPRPDATGYCDGALWDLGGVRVRAVHLPGHTTGHCVLLVEPQGIAFIGDIDLSGFGPHYGDAPGRAAAGRAGAAALRRALQADLTGRAWAGTSSPSSPDPIATDSGFVVSPDQQHRRRAASWVAVPSVSLVRWRPPRLPERSTDLAWPAHRGSVSRGESGRRTEAATDDGLRASGGRRLQSQHVPELTA